MIGYIFFRINDLPFYFLFKANDISADEEIHFLIKLMIKRTTVTILSYEIFVLDLKLQFLFTSLCFSIINVLKLHQNIHPPYIIATSNILK